MSCNPHEQTTFHTAGDLRAMLDGVSDEQIIMAQVVGVESGAWNMVPSFLPLAPHGSIAVLTLWHPMLATLPMMDASSGDLAPYAATPSGPSVRVRIAVAVSEEGRWFVADQFSFTTSDDPPHAAVAAVENAARLGKVASVCWVEADVPLPLAPQTIRGTVTASAEERCPDGLLPDGPVCPRCGRNRAPSGIDGGTWVHFDGAQRVNGVPVATAEE